MEVGCMMTLNFSNRDDLGLARADRQLLACPLESIVQQLPIWNFFVFRAEVDCCWLAQLYKSFAQCQQRWSQYLENLPGLRLAAFVYCTQPLQSQSWPHLAYWVAKNFENRMLYLVDWGNHRFYVHIGFPKHLSFCGDKFISVLVASVFIVWR